MAVAAKPRRRGERRGEGWKILLFLGRTRPFHTDQLLEPNGTTYDEQGLCSARSHLSAVPRALGREGQAGGHQRAPAAGAGADDRGEAAGEVAGAAAGVDAGGI